MVLEGNWFQEAIGSAWNAAARSGALERAWSRQGRDRESGSRPSRRLPLPEYNALTLLLWRSPLPEVQAMTVLRVHALLLGRGILVCLNKRGWTLWIDPVPVTSERPLQEELVRLFNEQSLAIRGQTSVPAPAGSTRVNATVGGFSRGIRFPAYATCPIKSGGPSGRILPARYRACLTSPLDDYPPPAGCGGVLCASIRAGRGRSCS